MAETGQHGIEPTPEFRSAKPVVRTQATSYAVRLTLAGHVQGVGFRPFVYRLAKECGITGYVQNRLGEVDIVACGRHEVLRRFRDDLIRRAPPLSKPRIAKMLPIDTAAYTEFAIASSSEQADARIYVPPDYFMCDDCRHELHDPGDRRYRYPFINCTQCGPRFTLIERLPYDRPNTSMADFPLCADCEAEYLDPLDRRFHAEPVACPDCGPQLTYVDAGNCDREGHAALEAALDALHGGRIVAVKGIGGYHLMCDARNDRAVQTLRRRKHRPAKPLAVMFPLEGADGLDAVRRCAEPSPGEARRLTSPARPIVLVTRSEAAGLAAGIAPGLAEIGVFLPYSPLHELLLAEFGAPLVATSGNISGEPVLTDNTEATERLAAIADTFLHHDRRIVRPADDSVYRRISDRTRPLRIGRGLAPVELELPWRQPQPVLAVGGHMKGTVALSWDRRVVVSPHIGEMDSPRSLAVFEQAAADLQSLYGVAAERIVCDAHRGYTTHRWARAQSLPVDTVWHHHAHASALAAEADLTGDWLIFTWDGVGLGDNGTLWGGEALVGEPGNWNRAASLRPFRLPGGERAGREPWRSAAALHWECGEDWPDCPDTKGLAKHGWQHGINCPQTSAVGRLFDAAAAIICGQRHVSFEAQGPMFLESLCQQRREPVDLPIVRDEDGVWRSDWQPLLAVMADAGLPPAMRAEIFHASLASMLLQQARTIRDDSAFGRVGLSGGVFQNRFLTEQATDLLQADGFRVVLAEKLPCNDAALSFGQVAELAARGNKG
jgi:hydrogenase maturation protein HypF